MKKYILALDQGTSSSRAFLFDLELNMVSSAQQELSLSYPQSDWVEQDPEEIYQSILTTIESCLERGQASPSEIAGIGITNQRETTIVWDKCTGECLHPAISWQSKQTTDLCEEYAYLNDDVKNKTGLLVDCYFSGLKIKWILDKYDAHEAARSGKLCFGTIDTWLVWRLSRGKSFVTDLTNASRTMLFNIQNLKWDQSLMDALGIPFAMLPEICSSSHDFGFAEDAIFAETKVPIFGIAGDQQAALYGQYCESYGEVKNTYGTGCFMLMNTESKMIHSEKGLLTTLACSNLRDPQYALEGSVFIAGAAVQWLRDALKIIDTAEESGELAGALDDNEGVYVVPTFSGLGTPHWRGDVKGACFGLTRASEDRHIARGTLEAIAYQSRDLLEVMQDELGYEIKRLKVDGGACASEFLMQFQADLLGVDVQLPEFKETSVLGAARLALEQYLAKRFVPWNETISNLYEPKLSQQEMSDKYRHWQAAIQSAIAFADATKK